MAKALAQKNNPAKRKTASKKVSAGPAKKAAKKATPQPVVSTGFWLMKSEPESYSIDQFAKDKTTLWTGVRNYQARNFMVSGMKVGDKFLFYHSNAEPSGAIGVGEILKLNQPDPTALDPKSDYYDAKASFDHPIWFCAEVGFKSKFRSLVSLADIRETPALKDMQLLRPGQRLSILPVEKSEFEVILKKGGL